MSAAKHKSRPTARSQGTMKSLNLACVMTLETD